MTSLAQSELEHDQADGERWRVNKAGYGLAGIWTARHFFTEDLVRDWSKYGNKPVCLAYQFRRELSVIDLFDLFGITSLAS